MDKCQIAHQCQVKKKVSWLFFNFTSKCQLDWIGIFVHKLWRHNWEGPWSSPYFSLIVQSLFCSHFLNELFEHIFIHKSIVLLLLTTHVLQGQASYMSQLGLGGGGHCALNRVLGGHFLGIKMLQWNKSLWSFMSNFGSFWNPCSTPSERNVWN